MESSYRKRVSCGSHRRPLYQPRAAMCPLAPPSCSPPATPRAALMGHPVLGTTETLTLTPPPAPALRHASSSCSVPHLFPALLRLHGGFQSRHRRRRRGTPRQRERGARPRSRGRHTRQVAETAGRHADRNEKKRKKKKSRRAHRRRAPSPRGDGGARSQRQGGGGGAAPPPAAPPPPPRGCAPRRGGTRPPRGSSGR